MKTHNRPLSPELPEEIRKYLETAPPLSQEDLAELRAAAGELDSDPIFQADYLKSLFVAKMLEALAEVRESQNQLAARWGKTRQYVSKLFNEDKRVNFTIETMAQLAHLLGRRIDLQVLRASEVTCVMRCVPVQRKISPPGAGWGTASTERSHLKDFTIRSRDNSRHVTPIPPENDESPDLAA